ncbi:glycerophosphodiester phosphodiesterase family protein [Gryllotalpicola sp.]|uniref:glycerophosphodiester phosphodiesterase family protein n=1 Tax=Gryllotalpicola sp. TaxID=1932787 RepID=UPI00262A319D|nr:glycerophosphodiester phosphodiesterase family protein [Gryllotalpicola sp.]
MRGHPSPIVIGHRGASGYRPEHTRSAYELAFQLGADAVEPDIVATKDGVLVIRHDIELSETTDVAAHSEFARRRTTKEVDGVTLTGWFVEDFSWPELALLRARERLGALRQASSSFDGQFPILKLSSLFDIVDAAAEREDRPFGLVAELKHPAYFEDLGLPLDDLFAQAVQDAGWSAETSRLVIESFERPVLAKVRKRGVRGTRVLLTETAEALVDLTAGDLEGVSVERALLLDAEGHARPELVDLAHADGLAVFAWTLRPENAFLAPAHRRGDADAAFGAWQQEFRAILTTGVDGVFADHPDLAAAVRDTLSVTAS